MAAFLLANNNNTRRFSRGFQQFWCLSPRRDTIHGLAWNLGRQSWPTVQSPPLCQISRWSVNISRPTDHLQKKRRAVTRTHQQGVGELHQAIDCLHGCGCQWWSLRASAVTLSISTSASSSHHQQTGSFHSHQQTIGEDDARNAEKWGVVLVEAS